MKYMNYIQVLYKAYDNYLNKMSVENGLTVTELKILTFLANDEENDLAKDIVNAFMLAKSHVSTSVSSLEEKEYIEKKQDENDKKKFHLKITKEGRKIVETIKPQLNNFKKELFQGLSDEEISCTKIALAKIAKNARSINPVLE